MTTQSTKNEHILYLANILALIVTLAFVGLSTNTMAGSHTKQDIVDTAVGAGSFTTLVAAVQEAGLVDTLKSEGPFTVFAPNDAAFAKLGQETINDLLKPENRSKLQAILTYHVVPGTVMAADVVKLNSAKTANGGTVSINTAHNKVMVNNANVVATDINCSNGVIHVIDTVLIP